MQASRKQGARAALLAVAVAIWAGGCVVEAGGEAGIEVSGVSQVCLDLRAELQGCVEGGWNRAECENRFRSGCAAEGLGAGCTLPETCDQIQEELRGCVEEGTDRVECETDFYRARAESFIASECAAVVACSSLKAEFGQCLAAGSDRADCEAVFLDDREESEQGSGCSVDDL